MTLEAVVFQQGLFGYTTSKDWYNNFAVKGLGIWGCESEPAFNDQEENKQMFLQNSDFSGCLNYKIEDYSNNCFASDGPLLSKICPSSEFIHDSVVDKHNEPTAAKGCKKRARTRRVKNKEQVENQRMIHINVERNRRKQMNEYLAVLRSLMPPSYSHRGDQASIVGGAINYVKELEQLLQSLEVQKRLKQKTDGDATKKPFADFFTFPQYSCSSSVMSGDIGSSYNHSHCGQEKLAENHSAIADIEVTMVESHANLKVLSRRRPGLLMKLIAGLQDVQLMPLHLNVTTVEQMVLYSFSLKVEDTCSCTSVDDIATIVYQMLGRIQEEANC